jgi:predicted LPLAT superfamily acyltransferase
MSGSDPSQESPAHWSKQKEEASYGHVKFLLILFRVFPVFLLRLIAFPVGFFYWLFSKRIREESRSYLERIPALKSPSPLKHILAFSLSLIEKVEAWGGKVSFKRIHFQDEVNDNNVDASRELVDRLERGEGAFVISSHLGNMEFIRGLAGFNRTGVSREVPVNAIMDTQVTAHFNRMLTELNPHSITRLVNVNDMGPETVILLQERLAAGELVVIAGDRTSAKEGSRILRLSFLGKEASFPYGPFFLAALLDAPVYFQFALRRRDVSLSSHYNLNIHRSPVSFACSRREREGRILELARGFVFLLEQYCKKHPYQWYNFYDFWAPPAPPSEHKTEGSL